MPEYRTPGVYIEEISAGPRPVQASSTTDTGFVAILTLPPAFTRAKGKVAGQIGRAHPQSSHGTGRSRFVSCCSPPSRTRRPSRVPESPLPRQLPTHPRTVHRRREARLRPKWPIRSPQATD